MIQSFKIYSQVICKQENKYNSGVSLLTVVSVLYHSTKNRIIPIYLTLICTPSLFMYMKKKWKVTCTWICYAKCMMTILIFVKAKCNSTVPPIMCEDYFPEKYNYAYCIFGMDGRQDLVWAFFHVNDLICPSQQWTIFLPSMQKWRLAMKPLD